MRDSVSRRSTNGSRAQGQSVTQGLLLAVALCYFGSENPVTAEMWKCELHLEIVTVKSSIVAGLVTYMGLNVVTRKVA